MQIDQRPLPSHWHWTDQDLSIHRAIEISRDHVLHGKAVKTLARRQYNDDVLFLVDGKTFATVHLTWSKHRHTQSQWSNTQLYDTWEEVYQNRILADKEDDE